MSYKEAKQDRVFPDFQRDKGAILYTIHLIGDIQNSQQDVLCNKTEPDSPKGTPGCTLCVSCAVALGESCTPLGPQLSTAKQGRPSCALPGVAVKR